MAERILFIIDEIELKYFEFNDLVTDFWLIKEFLKRNYVVDVATKRDLFIENAKGCVLSYNSYLKDENIFYGKEKSKNAVNDYKVVFFRPDPPVDIAYIDACYVFDYVDTTKTMLINNPREVKNFNEKFHINFFPEFVPENIITTSAEQIIEFTEKRGEAILKPLDRCFGSGVYYLNHRDKNLLTIISSMTENGRTPVMVQEYLPEAKFGDKRVLIIGNKVMDECIQKLPGEHNFKFSTHSDKFFKTTRLTDRERFIAEQTAKYLSEKGLYLVGLDMISEKITEINVTSPCYFIREINQHNNVKFEDKIMFETEKLIANYFAKDCVYAYNK